MSEDKRNRNVLKDIAAIAMKISAENVRAEEIRGFEIRSIDIKEDPGNTSRIAILPFWETQKPIIVILYKIEREISIIANTKAGLVFAEKLKSECAGKMPAIDFSSVPP